MIERESRSLAEVLEGRASMTPDRVLYQFLDRDLEVTEQLTYSALRTRSCAVAAALQSEGLRGETVMLLFPPGLDFIEAFLGCFLAGVIAVPVSPPDPVRLMRSLPRLRRIAQDAAALGVITTSRLRELCQSVFNEEAHHLRWLETDRITADRAAVWTPHHPSGEETAFLQYTSGSTTAPRGVRVSHANLMANERFIADACDLSEADQGVSWLPMVHDMGLIGGVLQPLYSGFPVQLLSPVTFLKRPLSWLMAISDSEATISPAPNFAYAYCHRRVREDDIYTLDLSSWRAALNGSEPVNADVMRRFQERFKPAGFASSAFIPCYGLAEATLLVSGDKPRDRAPRTVHVLKAALGSGRVEVVPSAGEETRALATCGRPSRNHRVAIVDPETAVPRSAGDIGEIWVSGPSVAQGYWRNPEATERLFRATLSSGEGPFLRTGDLGAFVDDELVVTGRLKDLLIIRGKNHYPQDIELSAEGAHGLVVPGGVVAVPTTVSGEEHLALLAELTRRPDPSELQHIEERIREAVARDHDIAAHVVALLPKRSLPKTTSGKLQRSATRERYRRGGFEPLHVGILNRPRFEGGRRVDLDDGAFAPEEGAIREWIARQLAKQLGIDPESIDPDKSFDTLGLDSAAAVEIVDAAEEWLGREVDGAVFYQYPTVNLLVRRLKEIL